MINVIGVINAVTKTFEKVFRKFDTKQSEKWTQTIRLLEADPYVGYLTVTHQTNFSRGKDKKINQDCPKERLASYP